MTTTAAAEIAHSIRTDSSRYRHDIDGLRAVAIILVVVYHVWVGRVSGGVDVFLMISAFFLTLSFARRLRADKPLAIGSFLISRFRRLLPAAAASIAMISAAAWALMPATTWPQLWREAWASLGYVQNWVLAASGVDYYARTEALPSPFQHFWSLSVQGQVFVLWPLIIAIAAVIVRRSRFSSDLVLTVLFGLVLAASLAFSIYETAANQTLAYFDTRTRLWEFAAGSLIALALPWIRLPRGIRALAGWVGLAAIVVCGLVIDVQGGFPGYLALWPVVATALVIVAGADTDTRGGPARFLAAAPVRFLGKDAYALYLVHWPILILWLTVQERTEAGPLSGTAIIALSFVAARLLTALVENPLRLPAGTRGSVPRNLAVIAVCALVVAAVVVPWQWQARAQATAAAEAAASAEYTGADGIPGERAEGVPLLPAAIDLDKEWVSAGVSCRDELAPDIEVLQGSCGQTPDAAEAERLIVVIGDSHAEQFMGTLLPVADEHSIGVVSLLKGACSLEQHASGSGAHAKCHEWQKAAIDYGIALEPEAVFTVVTAAAVDSPEERLIAGAQETIDVFLDAGIDVYGFRDHPRASYDLYLCAEERRDCVRPVSDALAKDNPANVLTGITNIDLTPWICPEGRCEVEIGNIAVYLDDNHLTGTFARTLAPIVGDMIGDVLFSDRAAASSRSGATLR
ncbi:acyltransferase family protein [Microbacterium sp. YY-01]|uniref:acyltransferase family protein n=1 Tax=Microbacterium sp. YY-01 TaxID=3421634 RepID=UPI003D177D8D